MRIQNPLKEAFDQLDAGHINEAKKSFIHLLSQKPNEPRLLFGLGLALSREQNYELSRHYIEQTLNMDNHPLHFDCFMILGVNAQNQKDYEQAAQCYKNALKLQPQHPSCLNYLGSAYHHLKKYHAAEKAYKKSIEIDEAFTPALLNLAMQKQSFGDFITARQLFKKAIFYGHQDYRVHLYLSLIYKYKPQDPHIQQMLTLFNKTKEPGQKIPLCFALAKAYNDTHDYAKACEYLKQGNQLQRQLIHYDINTDIRLFKQIKTLFKQNFIDKMKPGKTTQPTPIFIIGLPRSGTTLVEQIITNHSQVEAGGELFHLEDLVQTYFIDDWQRELFPNLEDYSDTLCQKIGEQYKEKLKTIDDNAPYITDKMPANFRWLGLIKCALPHAKIIHCQRNLKDNALSLFKTFIPTPGNGYASNINDLVKFCQLYTDLMQHWHKLFGQDIYTLSYEALVSKQKEETEKLLAYCNLNFEPQCLDFKNNQSPVKTASLYTTRQSINDCSVQSWQHYQQSLKDLFDQLPD